MALFGWSSEPLYAEQQLANLGYTLTNLCQTLRKAYQTRSPLKHSVLDKIEFTPVHGHRAVMKWDYVLTERSGGSYRFVSPGPGYWMVYADRVGSLGDDRHKWPVWDAHEARYEAPPKGMLTRELPRDYLGESFGRVTRPTEDILIAATIDKNKWRPGKHNEMPESLAKFFK